MKKLIFFLIAVLSIIGCTNQNKPLVKQPEKSINPVESYFSKLDTTRAGKSVACSGGIYKLIGDKYLIHFTSDLPVQFDSCYSVSMRDLNRKAHVELFVFDNKDASFSNICTDMIIVDSSKPPRTLFAESGEFILGYSDPIMLYGNKSQHTNILVKELVFVDGKTGEKIKIKNELLWKVLDVGTPG